MEPTAGPESQDPGLTDLEADLAGLKPARGRVDRDRLMFLAGRASASTNPRRSAWPALAAVFGLIAGGEAAWLSWRTPPSVVERIVVVREPAPAPPSDDNGAPRAPAPARPISPGTPYARRIEQLARFGLDGLPAPIPVAAGYGEPSPPLVAAGPIRDADIARLLNIGDSL